jgi:cyanophycinase
VTAVEPTGGDSGTPGPLALVGSGEYTAPMLDLERSLLDGRPPRYVQIPTAAGREGPGRLSYWVELGKAQAERIGVEAVPLVVTERAQADDPAVAAQVDGAGLIYLSGGSPAVLADTLRDTALWRAIIVAWRSGAALAGCSAGAMALADQVPDLRNPTGGSRPGLGLTPHLRVLPHFDKMLGWVPDVLTRPFFRTTGGVSLVGIDEDTALVGGPEDFTVYGRQSAWLLSDGRRQQFATGARMRLPSVSSAG